MLLGLNDIGFSETDEQPTYKPAPVVEAGEVIAGYGELIRQARGRRVVVVDLNRELADPGDPDRLRPSYGFGDHLHPNDLGYEVMAEAVMRCL